MRIADRIKIDYVALCPEEQIPRHVQDTWELVYVVVGRGVRTIDDITEQFSTGEVILIPPGMSHQWTFDPVYTDKDGNIVDVALFIDPAFLSEIALQLPDFAKTVRAFAIHS